VTPVYAVTLAVGVVLLLGWIAALAISEIVEGWDGVDPEKRFGKPGRLAVAGLAGFGLAGMSSTFGGWQTGFVFVAALFGATGIALAASFLGDETDTGAA